MASSKYMESSKKGPPNYRLDILGDKEHKFAIQEHLIKKKIIF